MSRMSTAAIALLAAASGCVALDPAEAELLVPDDIGLHWDRSFNGADDALVALVPVDVMVYESESGEPLEGMALDVDTGDASVDLLSFDAVYPVDEDACAGSACLWDARRDRYVEIGAGLADLDGPLHTDVDGLARFYVLVDGFPTQGASFDPVAVVVSMGSEEATFQLVPQ